jgi:hypothetical protein
LIIFIFSALRKGGLVASHEDILSALRNDSCAFIRTKNRVSLFNSNKLKTTSARRKVMAEPFRICLLYIANLVKGAGFVNTLNAQEQQAIPMRLAKMTCDPRAANILICPNTSLTRDQDS